MTTSFKSMILTLRILTALSTFSLFKTDLTGGHPDDFMNRLSILMKDLTGEDHCESTYRAITYLLAVLCGTPAIAEHHGYKGRSDLEVLTGKYIYVFEFKYNKSIRRQWSRSIRVIMQVGMPKNCGLSI